MVNVYDINFYYIYYHLYHNLGMSGTTCDTTALQLKDLQTKQQNILSQMLR